MGISTRSLVVGAVAVALVGGGGLAASAADTSSAAASSLYNRTELYFGAGKPDGSQVTPQEFAAFADRDITKYFPDGFTLLTGDGQYRMSDGKIVKERSYVVVLLYPLSDREATREIDTIRADYKRDFRQESVLRADSLEKVSF